MPFSIQRVVIPLSRSAKNLARYIEITWVLVIAITYQVANFDDTMGHSIGTITCTLLLVVAPRLAEARRRHVHNSKNGRHVPSRVDNIIRISIKYLRYLRYIVQQQRCLSLTTTTEVAKLESVWTDAACRFSTLLVPGMCFPT